MAPGGCRSFARGPTAADALRLTHHEQVIIDRQPDRADGNVRRALRSGRPADRRAGYRVGRIDLVPRPRLRSNATIRRAARLARFIVSRTASGRAGISGTPCRTRVVARRERLPCQVGQPCPPCFRETPPAPSLPAAHLRRRRAWPACLETSRITHQMSTLARPGALAGFLQVPGRGWPDRRSRSGSTPRPESNRDPRGNLRLLQPYPAERRRDLRRRRPGLRAA